MTTIRWSSSSFFIVLGLACVLVVIMTFVTVSNIRSEQDLIRYSTLTQGYWIARSLEIGHRMIPHNDIINMRATLRALGKAPTIRFMMVLDDRQHVLVASNDVSEGMRWPKPLQPPTENGRILDHVGDETVLAFPAFFARGTQLDFIHFPKFEAK